MGGRRETAGWLRLPWVQIAVVKETEGKGPYCSLVMAVVVLKDVLVFVCFAVNIELAKAVSGRPRRSGVQGLQACEGGVCRALGFGVAASLPRGPAGVGATIRRMLLCWLATHLHRSQQGCLVRQLPG